MNQGLPLDDLAALTARAAARRDRIAGGQISYSRKVFIPLTSLCRDVCHYCTFAKAPRAVTSPYLDLDEVRAIARAGQEAGCREALFTLGDKPELRYRAARDWLDAHGFASTADYLAAAARMVLEETGLLPHLNPGVLDARELAMLRPVAASMGIMVESVAPRLSERGGPHFGSPDKQPAVRLAMIEEAGRQAIPFTTGLLIGIGETRAERIETIAAIGALHARHGHIQEVIVQNFRAKPGTRMAAAPEPDLDELRWTIAAARLLLPDEIAIQAPPNLSPGALAPLVDAGISDWGGVSPVTPDHVNPEAAWPALARLAHETEAAGKLLVERLTLYPRFVRDAARWTDPSLRPRLLALADGEGLARDDSGWRAGVSPTPPAPFSILHHAGHDLSAILAKAEAETPLDTADIAALFGARGGAFDAVVAAADAIRARQCGDAVSYVVTRNINYTNICAYACAFCAFSKGRGAGALRGPAYDLDLDEVARRAAEAQARGAVELCMQGGIHPAYDGSTYLALLRTAKVAAPALHVHAFSPLEVAHGAATSGLSLDAYLGALRDAGLGSLPGTAAEILHPEVRAVLCPDKVDTGEWLRVMETAHGLGLPTTATIMFGHIERYDHLAAHLIALRDLQIRTGGFTEFVPLPFVANEAPIFRAGKARPGPTWREALLMHAIARLTLGPWFRNIQASWVKLGPEGAVRALGAGANDLGGTLMNESITRAAGAAHGEEMDAERMERLIGGAGRTARPRTTLYRDAAPECRARALAAPPLAPVVLTAPRKRAVGG